VKFTVKSTAALTLPPGKTDLVVFDDAFPGFGMRLRSGGSRNWIYQYAVGNQQRRMVIGKAGALALEEARTLAARLHAQTKLGTDPAGVKDDSDAKSGETFAACLKLYLERRRREPRFRPSTYREIERHLVRNLKALHGLHIAKVDRRAIAIELARLTAVAPVQANRTRASLVKFLSWCAGEGFIDSNPAQFTNKNPEASRSRCLGDGELAKLWQALPESDFGDVVRLLLLCGARKSEIGGLAWSEVDLSTGRIALPASRAKTHQARFIPISATMRAILEARPQTNDRDYVFGRGRGFSGWSQAKNRLDAVVKLPAWTIHDIRRSVATGMGQLGIPPFVIEGVLGHVGSRGGVAGIYNRAQYETEKATALARWDAYLADVLANKKTNVAPLKRA
jgi:integrase